MAPTSNLSAGLTFLEHRSGEAAATGAAPGLGAGQLWLCALPQPALRRIAELRMPCRPALPAATARRMLEVSNPGHEEALGIDFAEVYARSELAK